MRLDRLRGRRAVVTGASSGMGREFAVQLAAAGSNLVLVARRRERLEELAVDLRGRHDVQVDVMDLDLTSEESREQLCSDLEKDGKDVDVLVNNAGFGIYGPFHETAWERVRYLIELDVAALVHLTHLFLPGMRARGSGYVLQVGSTAAYQPTPLYGVYAAAKSFVLLFGEALNHELSRTGVSCTVLSPGQTLTEFHEVSGQELTLYQRLTMMPPEKVVRCGLRGMLGRRSNVVPGLFNWFMAWNTRFVPRRLSAIAAHMLMR
ncbi:MAG: SDR family oxidoreductase [Deltaproteobacteria bacterium]|nr:SDR family oxidoreductase [Deltaproteobacteria bacterium]